MNRSRRNPVTMGLAAGISALMLTLSVAVPVLDEGTLFDQPIVESEHGPGDCPSGHDHTVCTQFSANLAIDGRATESPEAPSSLVNGCAGGPRVSTARCFDRGNPSRAPPLA